MKLRLDENFDLRLVPFLASEGFDVDSVVSERLSGSGDELVYQTCCTTGRVLVTLDLDFSNPFRFPPGDGAGTLIVRPPRPLLSMIQATLASVLSQLRTRPLKGELWIVEPGRIRVYDPEQQS